MAIEGLEIAPGGIGSGEAQVFKTPFTERAFLYNVEKENQRKAQEEEISAKEQERVANELAKIEIDKIHPPDAPKLIAKYNDIIGTDYYNWKNAKTKQEKALRRNEILRKQQELLLDINASRQRLDQVKKVGDSLLGRNRDEVGKDFVTEWELMSKTPTSEYEYSPLKFVGKGKPEFLVDIEKNITTNSMSPESTRIYEGKVGEKDVIITENGSQLYRPVFVQNSIDYYSKSPSYRDTLVKLYRDEYVSQGGDMNDEEAFADYAVNKRFDTLKVTTDVSKKTASQVGTGFNFNFGGGGTQTNIPNWKDPVIGTTTITKTENINGTEFTTESAIPVAYAEPVNTNFKFNPSEGYFAADGKYVEGGDAIDVKTTRVVTLPVTKNSDVSYKGGQRYSLVSSENTTFSSRNTRDRKTKASQLPKSYDYINFVEAEDRFGDKYYIPLESAPQGEINRADLPAFRNALQRNQKTSLKQVGGGAVPAQNQSGKKKIEGF